MIVPLAINRSEAAVRQREVKLGYMKSKEQHRFATSTPPRLDCFCYQNAEFLPDTGVVH
jgi:hypothetical protein